MVQTDLGCQIQWFTHLLFPDGESSVVLWQLIAALMRSFGSAFDGLAALYNQEMCSRSVPSAHTAETCPTASGCMWNEETGVCSDNVQQLRQAERFSQLMCFSDGTGSEMSAAEITERATDLASFFSMEHVKPYLSFYFDKGFSEQNPHLKFTRGFMQFVRCFLNSRKPACEK